MDLQLVDVGRGVYACLQPGGGLGRSNSGLVAHGGGLVVDTFWDLPHTRGLIEQYRRVWPHAARRVVNTHANGDHCWGNQLFPEAEIIGHRRCAEAFARESPEAMQALKGMRDTGDPALRAFAEALAPFDFEGVDLRPPTTVFDESLSLELDDLEARLLYVGPAHTAADVIVHLPAERVVFAGDVVFRLCTPIGWEGTYAGWYAALDAIVALEPEVVVPGHGPLCGLEGPREMKAYLEYVRGEAERFFAQGLSVVEASKRIDPGPYASWAEPERIVFNVDRAYREIRCERWDAPIDVAAVFRGIYEVRQSRRA